MRSPLDAYRGGAAMKAWMANPWQRYGLPAPVGWLASSVYSVSAVMIVASSVFRLRGIYSTRPVDEVVTVVCLLVTAACAARAARFAIARRRIGWLAMVTAL